ncbi:MAG: hypothetical protein K2G54_02465 [Malacoplasma sp.]|nr:hypothetical protein [Malacoplasma sp.]
MFNGNKIIISYSPTYDEEILKTIIGAQKDDYNLIHFKRNATQKDLLEIIEKGVKNPK